MPETPSALRRTQQARGALDVAVCGAHLGGTKKETRAASRVRRKDQTEKDGRTSARHRHALGLDRGLGRNSKVRVARLLQHQRALDGTKHVALPAPGWWRSWHLWRRK